MAVRFYRLLLRLLPRQRRERFGGDMALLFADLQTDERREHGLIGVVVLWMKEATGMARFVIREWLTTARGGRPPRDRRGPGLATEVRWAWRGVQARGWRAVFVVGLLAVTLAANAATFSVVDSLVFRPQPYPEAERIAVLEHSSVSSERIDRLKSAALYGEWRKQTDLFTSVGGYLRKSIFLTGGGTIERVSTVDITVGLLDVLDVRPRWGRAFAETDLQETGGYAALISEDLAKQKFGRPDLAPGRRLDATGGPLIVVGVMSSDFAFPDASYRIWRALDPSGPLTEHSVGVRRLMGRLAPGVLAADLPARFDQRGPIVGRSVGLQQYKAGVLPFATPRNANERRTMLILLLGGAACLLLTACANVASLELATAAQRAPARAIHLALGASRATLARVIAMEGGLLVSTALAVGLTLTWLIVRLMTTYLPDSIRLYTENPINLDVRVVWYAAAAAGLTWLLASLAPLVAASRSAVRALLSLAGRSTTTSSGSARLRQVLTALEVALAVALVVVGLLYARSYQALLRVDKGFDSSGMAVISASIPAYYFGPGEQSAFGKRVIDELSALPGVLGVSNSSPPPEIGDSPGLERIQIDGRPAPEREILLSRKRVDASYFRVTRLPLRRGRYLEPSDPTTNVVIAETFAHLFWLSGDAVGQSFQGLGWGGPITVVGVVGDFRTGPRRMPDDTDTQTIVYTLIPPSSPAPVAITAPGQAPLPDTGGMHSFLSFTVRMDSPARTPAVKAAVQRLDPRLRVAVELVDDIYAAQNADVLLASRVVGGFSVLAFLVAITGLYGVVAFFVASRTREIGIRMTLGADRRDISRMVLTSSGRLVVIGSIAGVAAAFWGARWIESQLFGVSRSDPFTYAAVIGAVTLAALVATWLPARQAARIDPAITLRAE